MTKGNSNVKVHYTTKDYCMIAIAVCMIGLSIYAIATHRYAPLAYTTPLAWLTILIQFLTLRQWRATSLYLYSELKYLRNFVKECHKIIKEKYGK